MLALRQKTAMHDPVSFGDQVILADAPVKMGELSSMWVGLEESRNNTKSRKIGGFASTARKEADAFELGSVDQAAATVLSTVNGRMVRVMPSLKALQAANVIHHETINSALLCIEE